MKLGKLLLLAGALLGASVSLHAQLITAQFKPAATGMLTPFGRETEPEFLTVNFGDGSASAGLFQFDLGSIHGPVTSATLALYHASNSFSGLDLSLYRVTEDWTGLSGSFTTSSLPAYAERAATLEIRDSATFVWRTVDLTALVQDWVSGTADNHGILLKRDDSPNPFVYIGAQDGGSWHAPVLSVSFGSAAPAPVPEPSTYGLLGAGVLVGLAFWRRRAARR